MLRRVYWVLASLACLGFDYLGGPSVQFPVFYLIPVSLAAWFDSRAWGLALAIVLPLVRLALHSIWGDPLTWATLLNAAIRITVFSLFAWLVARTASQMVELRQAIRRTEFERELCANCKERVAEAFDRR